MRATQETREKKVEIVETEDLVHIELTADEARVLKALIGSIGGCEYDSEVYRLIVNLYDALSAVNGNLLFLYNKAGNRVNLEAKGASLAKRREL